MSRLQTPDQFKKPLSLTVMGLIGLVLAFFMTVRALDSGSYWHYLAVLILLVLSIRLLVRVINIKKQ